MVMRRPNRILPRSQGQEKRIAHDLGGRTTPGSGSQWFAKNDVQSREWSVEAKRTDKRQYIMKLEELLKMEIHAIQDGKNAAMQIEIGNKRYAIINWDLFLKMQALGNV